MNPIYRPPNLRKARNTHSIKCTCYLCTINQQLLQLQLFQQELLDMAAELDTDPNEKRRIRKATPKERYQLTRRNNPR